MTFTYSRTVHLADTDAAGVIFFARGMEICHEACEAALIDAGISLQQLITENKIAFPIVRAEIDFFRPLVWGDKIQISLTAARLKDSEYEIVYQVVNESTPDKISIQASTRHVCINTQTRTRVDLPDKIVQWINQFN